jgi:putative CGCGG family rSAM target protein
VVEEAIEAVEHTTAGNHVNLVTHGDHGHPESYLYDRLREAFDDATVEYVDQCGCGGHVTRVHV